MDIVEQLMSRHCCQDNLDQKAADEIKRLRKALQEIFDHDSSLNDEYTFISFVAKNALHTKPQREEEVMDIVDKLRRYRPTYGWPEERSVIVEPTMNHVAADEIERLRDLIKVLLYNDPDDIAADAVTVLEVWRKEASEALGIKKPKFSEGRPGGLLG